MIQSFFICDGCDKREPQVTPEGKPPPSFTHQKVTVGNWGADFDLCPQCYDRLLKQSDPRKWDRAAAPQ